MTVFNFNFLLSSKGPSLDIFRWVPVPYYHFAPLCLSSSTFINHKYLPISYNNIIFAV